MRATTSVIALALLGSLVAGGAMAQTVTRSHPVGVRFDGDLHPSRVYVRFAATPIDQGFEAWRRTTLDPPAQSFVRLVRSAIAGDVVAGRPALDLRHTGPASTETALRLIGGLAGGWGDARIVARFVVDGSHVFVFRAARADGPATGALAFDQVNGVWKGRVLTSKEPVASLIVDAYDNLGREPSAFAPLPQTRTAYAMPLSADDTVWLEFDGQQMSFEPLGEQAAPTSDAVALYQQAVLALARTDWGSFAALHTPASKAKIDGWLANEGRDPRALKTAAALIARDTRVIFEMDLGPAGAALFYGQGEQMAPGEQALKRVMVARTPAGMQLTSYYMTYQFGLTLMRSPRWPKRAGELDALLARSKR